MDYILSESSTPVEKKSRGINWFTLKIIAYVFMLLDLIGIYILETHVFDINSLVADGAMDGYTTAQLVDLIFRLAGGIAFPLFCFFIVEGFLKTSDIKKYVLRLTVCAIVTEFIWDIANGNGFFYMQDQNPLFTLLIGLVVLIFIRKFHAKTVLQAFSICAGVVLCSTINSQFGMFGYGVILIVLMYATHEKKLFFSIFGSFLTIIASIFNGYLLGILAFAIIPFYSGKQGPKVKYPFYFIYPAALIILHLIGVLFF